MGGRGQWGGQGAAHLLPEVRDGLLHLQDKLPEVAGPRPLRPLQGGIRGVTGRCPGLPGSAWRSKGHSGMEPPVWAPGLQGGQTHRAPRTPEGQLGAQTYLGTFPGPVSLAGSSSW